MPRQFVNYAPPKEKTKQVTVSLPERDVDKLTRYQKATGQNRTTIIAASLRECFAADKKFSAEEAARTTEKAPIVQTSKAKAGGM